MLLRAAPHGPLAGTAKVPGDKSISHRSLMLAALGHGTSRIAGLLEGEDVMTTAGALRRLGVSIERDPGGEWRVAGQGPEGLGEPSEPLDLGNAGTGCRLLMGILAGLPFTSFLTGDGSLRARPMARVAEPLMAMGASIVTRSGGRLPLAITGRRPLRAVDWRSRAASAQVKSAILLAGLAAEGRTSVTEPAPSRDHTERMLAGMGARVVSEILPDGSYRATIDGGAWLEARSFTVPGDPSSAAFPIVAAAMAPGSEVTIRRVGVNPLRTGLLTTLRQMGARLSFLDERLQGGEHVADLRIEGGPLRCVEVPAARAPSMIDEYPILAVAAARATGRTVMRGLEELRVKESDRLAAMAGGLAACGVTAMVEGDTLIVEGGGPPTGGALIDAHLDHRIAMSFLVLGGLSQKPIVVGGAETIATSFPGFAALMRGLGADIAEVEG